MSKQLNIYVCAIISLLLALSVVNPQTAKAMEQIIKPAILDNVISQELETDYYLNDVVDKYLNETAILDINFDQMTELEAEEFFDSLIETKDYMSLENDINNYIVATDRLENGDTISTYALPVAFAAIGVIALRIAVTQGTKAATAYLKRAVKKYTKTYKITFPSSKQLILIQDKKTKKRIFSVDKHSVKLVHKKTGKGYPKAFSAWHFHKSPTMGNHYLMCSSIPKNYKVQKGKCYF